MISEHTRYSQGGETIDRPCTNHYKEDRAVAVVETGEASVGLRKCSGSRAFGGEVEGLNTGHASH